MFFFYWKHETHCTSGLSTSIPGVTSLFVYFLTIHQLMFSPFCHNFYIYIYVCMYIIHTHHPCCWTAHHLIENKTEDYHYPCRGVLSTRWNQLLLLCSRSCWLSGYSVFVTKFCFNIGLQLQTSLLIIFRPCLWYPYLTLANLFSTFLPCLSHLFCKTRENVSLFRFHSTSNCKQAGELLPIASFFHPSSSMFFFSFLCFEKQIKDSPRSLHQIG